MISWSSEDEICSVGRTLSRVSIAGGGKFLKLRGVIAGWGLIKFLPEGSGLSVDSKMSGFMVCDRGEQRLPNTPRLFQNFPNVARGGILNDSVKELLFDVPY